MARVPFTARRVQSFKCPLGKKEAFLWDSAVPGLGLRSTEKGGLAYIFQARFGGRTVRVTIGGPAAWPLAEAQAKARELQRSIDEGVDPREKKQQALAEAEARHQKKIVEALTVSEVWQVYLEERRPRWGERHFTDHIKLARSPGEDRFGRETIAGPLYVFMEMRLVDITQDIVQEWAKQEEKVRKTQAQLAWRLLRAFFNWCAEQKEYVGLLAGNPAKNRATREVLGKSKARRDVLLKEQLPAFFNAVRGLSNHTASVYIQALLLTGARPGELLSLKWADVDARWKAMTIRDKDESKGGENGTRTIPLTPFVHSLLSGLPKRTEWVFSSNAKSQPIRSPHERLAEAAQIAGIEDITFQGLRRSFGSLSEWLDLPAGVIAQIQGHKPSATREKHYIVRPLDLLREHHERLEGWILEVAGVPFGR